MKEVTSASAARLPFSTSLSSCARALHPQGVQRQGGRKGGPSAAGTRCMPCAVCMREHSSYLAPSRRTFLATMSESCGAPPVEFVLLKPWERLNALGTRQEEMCGQTIRDLATRPQTCCGCTHVLTCCLGVAAAAPRGAELTWVWAYCSGTWARPSLTTASATSAGLWCCGGGCGCFSPPSAMPSAIQGESKAQEFLRVDPKMSALKAA